jgi:alpha-galactosidase
MVTLFAVVLGASVVLGAAPAPDAMDEAGRWAAAKFAGEVAADAGAGPSLLVIANNDPVQQNGRHGKPMRLAGQEFTRGLYCHAHSEVVVRLGAPARSFRAVVGVDSNDQTSGGRGSVVFAVRIDGKEAWRSALLREGMPVVPVEVPLEGAREFTLVVEDSGDGISCDQADWANAEAVLEDGTVVALGELPIAAWTKRPYTAEPFFSFAYGSKPSREFLAEWPVTRSAKRLDDTRTAHTIIYTDPATGLSVRCEGIAFSDFPTLEWTVYLRNDGATDTPIVSDLKAVDTLIERSGADEFVLHHHTGDNCAANSYEPHTTPLGPNGSLNIANAGGRPTQHNFPYFNVQAAGEGVIFVVSWAGQWTADFVRDSANGLRLRAGQEDTHFVLHPGEEVRTPMIVLQFWQGDRVHAQNVWRQWMIAHNMPRPGGKLPPLPQLAACSSHQFGEMIHANTENQIFFVDGYLKHGMKLDYWWMDAGWYINESGWPQTGTWEVDRKRFPNGLREISDHVHAKGMRTLLWFEPERVAKHTWLADERSDWVYGGADGGLLKLGEPEVREWLTDHVDRVLVDEGIDLYRQDFNMDPLGHWRGNDTEDRRGITENRHVTAYFAYWDELRRRHPDMLIDSCASGGRRNDLETLRRAVPLLRSDYIMEPVGNQCHTHALSSWFPFHGTGTSKTEPYLVRSVLCQHFISCWDMRDENLDFAALSREIAQWREYGQYYFGDYYALTPYTLADDQWIAWQFHDEKLKGGMVQAFRRAGSVYESARLPLHGVDATKTYAVRDIDSAEARVTRSGAELLEKGLPVKMETRPDAVVLVYREVE